MSPLAAASHPAPATAPGQSLGRTILTALCAYTAAFLLTTLLHELAHAVVGKLLGTMPVLYNSHVDGRNEQVPAATTLAVALAGPLFSLLQGAVLLALARRDRGSGFGSLTLLFLAVFGLINFLGYVMTSPFVPYGDLGKAVVLLGLPQWAALVAAVVSAALLAWVIRGTGPLFLRFVPAAAQPVLAERGRYVRGLLLWPWLLGSIIITALAWPLPTLLSLIYPPMSSMVLGAAWGGAMRAATSPQAATAPLLPRQLGLALGALLVTAAVFWGLRWGVAL
ncbi:hypothetical protein [Hymenobacter jeollabukensis]|uniref:M50 family metallopeptidase n=1 Tax=Hymenobacter jeollabukensis TaxID=2025313 RepID=A0A5R8WIN5_9BACT|nr:hypothetical protein [Hymenobacter jeollabukensis]TLM88583.1 hypothetical protein FDY95_23835 [Hymenobacter jeollabukensis]